MLQHGAEHVHKDSLRAIYPCQQPIDVGDPDAMFNLALMLQHDAKDADKNL